MSTSLLYHAFGLGGYPLCQPSDQQRKILKGTLDAAEES